MTGAPGLILPAKHPKKNYETNPFVELSTVFSINWLAHNEANFQPGQWRAAQLDPRIAPAVNTTPSGFA